MDEPQHSAGDIFYRSRHQRVSELVFNLALSSEEDKFDLLANLMLGINVDYSSDNETFSRMIRGRAVATMFLNVELGRLLYDRAEEAAKGLVQGNPVAVAIVERDPSLLPVITKAVAQAITDRFGEKDIRAPMRAIVVQARA